MRVLRYLYPKVKLPKAISQVAEMNNKTPDMFYCLAMLGETGVVTVPGSEYDQKEGTFHFRTGLCSLSFLHILLLFFLGVFFWGGGGGGRRCWFAVRVLQMWLAATISHQPSTMNHRRLSVPMVAPALTTI